jgi:hypothetical protein
MAFEKGNPGGPGRPPKAVEDAKQSVLFELFDEKAERAIVLNMVKLAKRSGAMQATAAISAATWLWDRKYGKVKEQMELSGSLAVKGYVNVSPDDWPDKTDSDV